MEMLLNLWDFSLDRLMALMGEGEPVLLLVQSSESQMTSQAAFETFCFLWSEGKPQLTLLLSARTFF